MSNATRSTQNASTLNARPSRFPALPNTSHFRLRRVAHLAAIALFAATAGCASKPESKPIATDELNKIPIADTPAGPLATDGEPQKQQVVVDSVNDTVDRFDQIIKQREQANRNAADLRETRAAAGQPTGHPAAKPTADEEAATVEKLAAQLREHKAIDPIPAPVASTPVEAASPTAPPPVAAANRPLDANAKPDQAAGQSVDPSPVADASGAINAAPSIELNRGGNPTLSRGTSADPMLAMQQKLATRVADDPRDLSAQLDLQLSRFLHDEPVPTMNDLAALPVEDRELLAAMCDALSNFRSIVRADGNPLNSVKARPFIDMAERIRARADLTLSGLTLCQRVSSFGVYDAIDPLVFRADGIKKVVVYCEVDGFLSQLNGAGKWETKTSLDLKLYDEHNLQVWNMAGKPTVDLAARRRRDFFLAQLVELPAKLPPGHYMLKARVSDLVGNRVAEQTIQFEVQANGVPIDDGELKNAGDLPHIPRQSVKESVKR